MSRRSGQCLPCLDLITLITLFNVFRPSLQKCFQTVVDHIVVGVGGREDSCRLTVISSQWWRPVCLQLLLILNTKSCLTIYLLINLPSDLELLHKH